MTYLRHMTRIPRFDTFKNTDDLIICPKPLHETKSMEFRFHPYSEKLLAEDPLKNPYL